METKTSPGYFIALSLFFLMAGGLAWWLFLNADPVAVTPSPTLPKPNAYDDYVAAGNALVDPDELDTITDRGPNAATLSTKQKVVNENRAALARLRVGLGETFWNPPIRTLRDSVIHDITVEKTFRRLGFLLKAEGDVKASHGDWNGAAQAGLDGIKLGSDIPHGTGLVEVIFGSLCEAPCRKLIIECIPHLNASQARSASARLETICDNHFTFVQTVQEEKWESQAIILQSLDASNIYSFEIANASVGKAGWVGATGPRLFADSKRAIYGNYTKTLDDELKIAALPYDKTAGLSMPARPLDPILKNFIPDHSTFERYHFRETACERQDVGLMTELALHAYQLDHHAYPETLRQLVPGYLARVPDYPADVSGHLHYARSGTRYLLTHE